MELPEEDREGGRQSGEHSGRRSVRLCLYLSGAEMELLEVVRTAHGRTESKADCVCCLATEEAWRQAHCGNKACREAVAKLSGVETRGAERRVTLPWTPRRTRSCS